MYVVSFNWNAGDGVSETDFESNGVIIVVNTLVQRSREVCEQNNASSARDARVGE